MFNYSGELSRLFYDNIESSAVLGSLPGHSFVVAAVNNVF